MIPSFPAPARKILLTAYHQKSNSTEAAAVKGVKSLND
jgi:hypothetical protein